MRKVKLDEIFEIARGGSPRPIKKFVTKDPSGVNWIKIGDTTESKYITDTKEKIIKEGVSKSRYVEPGDFLLTNSMSFGRPYILKIDGCIHDGWLVLKPKSDQILEDYIYYILGSPVMKREFKKKAKGTTVKNLNISLVSDVEIPLPTLEKQKAIIAKLDRAQRLIEIDKEMLAKYDELIQSVFLEMFGDPVTNPKGWDVKKLGDLSNLITKGSSPGWQGFDYVDDGIRFITSKNVRLGYLDCSEDQFIPKAFHEKLSRSELMVNDLLVNLVGASIGRGALVSNDELPANINQAVAKIELKQDLINPKFLLQLIITPQVQDKLIGKKVEGARANISLTNVKELEIYYPPIDEQLKFSQILDSFKKEKSQTVKILKKSEELFSSLVQEAFQMRE